MQGKTERKELCNWRVVWARELSIKKRRLYFFAEVKAGKGHILKVPKQKMEQL